MTDREWVAVFLFGVLALAVSAIFALEVLDRAGWMDRWSHLFGWVDRIAARIAPKSSGVALPRADQQENTP